MILRPTPLDVDRKNLTITFANHEWKHYYRFHSTKKVVTTVPFIYIQPANPFVAQGRFIETEPDESFEDLTRTRSQLEVCSAPKPEKYNYYAERYRHFTSAFGITPSNFRKIFNAAAWNLWVKPIEPWAWSFAYTRNGFKPRILNRIGAALPILSSLYPDTYNIAPIVILYNRPLPEIKSILGRKLWRDLCHNSKTRNRLIMNAVLAQVDEGAAPEGESVRGIDRRSIEFLNTVPSTFLARPRAAENARIYMEMRHAHPNLALRAFVDPKASFLADSFYTIRDTIRMYEQMGHEPPSHITMRSWKQKHEEITKLQRLGQYPHRAFKWLDVDPDLKNTYKFDRFQFRPLCTPYEVYREGEVMGHCVASYVPDINAGRYVVWSVYEDGAHKGTLGCSRRTPHTGRLTFNQLKGHHNSCLSHDTETMSIHLITMLNKRPYVDS